VEDASLLSKKIMVMARIIFKTNKIGMKGIELMMTLIPYPPTPPHYYISL